MLAAFPGVFVLSPPGVRMEEVVWRKLLEKSSHHVMRSAVWKPELGWDGGPGRWGALTSKQTTGVED